MKPKTESLKVKPNYHPAYRADIDGLRALAILAVVIFHAFPAKLRGGFVGVDVFFVISGYLISTILFRGFQRGDFRVIDFYGNRIRRIFPALAVVLAACGALGWWVLLPDEYSEMGKHMAGGAGFIVNFMLWSEAGYFDTQSELKPLMHLWSLAIEEQFYLIYPLLIWLAWRLRIPILPVLLALLLFSFGLNVNTVHQNSVGAFFWPQTRFWELLSGALPAFAQSPKAPASLFLPVRARFDNPNIKSGLSVLGLLLILSAMLVLHKGKHFPGWWALMPMLGSVLLIMAGPQAWVNRVILANSVMVFIGLISYPLYLWHWPLLSFLRIMDSGESPAWGRVASVILSFLLAWLTWRIVERPIRFGRKTLARTGVLCGLILMAGGFGYWVHANKGVSWRFDNPEIQAFTRTQPAQNRSVCQTIFKQAGKEDYCAVGQDIEPDIALLGDSHSAHLYPGLVEKKLKVINIGRSSCIPLYGVGFGTGGSECPLGYMDKVLDFAIQDNSIKVMALASRFAAQVEGVGYDARIKAKPGSIKLFSHDREGNPEVFRQALYQTLQRLVLSGKKIVLILDVPELGFSPKACVRPVTLLTDLKAPCALSQADFDERSKQYRTIIESVRKDFPAVTVFDSPALFCDGTQCWAEKYGKMLYRDSDHLSIEGSEFVAESLGAFLRSMLP